MASPVYEPSWCAWCGTMQHVWGAGHDGVCFTIVRYTSCMTSRMSVPDVLGFPKTSCTWQPGFGCLPCRVLLISSDFYPARCDQECTSKQDRSQSACFC